MKQLESTPPAHLLSQNAADRVVTPAKRTLCSAAVIAEVAPSKRLCMMHTPDGSAGQPWQQQRMMPEGECGMEGSSHEPLDPMGTQLPLRTQPESRVSRPYPPPHGDVMDLSNTASCTTSSTGGLGIGRATSGLLSVAKPPTRHHSTRTEVGSLKSGSRGTVAGFQLRTPLRPNSAGSALRGYVPPEHRLVTYRSDIKTALSFAT